MTITTSASSRSARTLPLPALDIGVRKLVTVVEETRAEGGIDVSAGLRQASCVAIIANPWFGLPPTADLQPETERIAPVLAKLLSDRLAAALGGVGTVVAFGKAAVVGLNGELEHAAAMIHTPFFGNLLREFLDGTSIICFSDARSEAGSSLRVPLWHKTQAATRSHYQSLDVNLPDAPHAGEIAIIAAASSGSRPNPRIGDRTTDPDVTSSILKGSTP